MSVCVGVQVFVCLCAYCLCVCVFLSASTQKYWRQRQTVTFLQIQRQRRKKVVWQRAWKKDKKSKDVSLHLCVVCSMYINVGRCIYLLVGLATASHHASFWSTKKLIIRRQPMSRHCVEINSIFILLFPLHPIILSASPCYTSIQLHAGTRTCGFHTCVEATEPCRSGRWQGVSLKCSLTRLYASFFVQEWATHSPHLHCSANLDLQHWVSNINLLFVLMKQRHTDLLFSPTKPLI